MCVQKTRQQMTNQQRKNQQWTLDRDNAVAYVVVPCGRPLFIVTQRISSKKEVAAYEVEPYGMPVLIVTRSV